MLAGTTWKILAASFTVNAVVLAPPLTEQATIASPVNGHVFTTTPITVAGVCPMNSYVKLYRNNFFSGVAICANRTFSITTDLFQEANTLTVQDFNVTDQMGPSSSPVLVYYRPVVSRPTNGNTGIIQQSVGSQNKPLVLSSEFHYQTFVVTQPFAWNINLRGGKSPYIVHTDWNDSTTTTTTLETAQTFEISHTFHTPGIYSVVIRATDREGSTALVQLIAIIHGKPSGVITATSIQNLPSWLQRIREWLWVIWPTYGIITLMATSFWLGERQEYDKLKDIGKRLRRHA